MTDETLIATRCGYIDCPGVAERIAETEHGPEHPTCKALQEWSLDHGGAGGTDLPLPRWLMEMAEDPLQHEHVVIVHDIDITVRHPLIERRNYELDDCGVLDEVTRMAEHRPIYPGRHILRRDPLGAPWLEPTL